MSRTLQRYTQEFQDSAIQLALNSGIPFYRLGESYQNQLWTECWKESNDRSYIGF